MTCTLLEVYPTKKRSSVFVNACFDGRGVLANRIEICRAVTESTVFYDRFVGVTYYGSSNNRTMGSACLLRSA